MSRLPTAVESSAFLRQVEALGGHGVVIQKGDADRGSILLVIQERGAPVTLLERMPALSGEYRWDRVGPTPDSDPKQLADYLNRRRRADADMWILELDIVPAERFIAETIAQG